MDILNTLLRNEFFMSAALSWLIAQILKTIIHLIFNREFVAERLVGSGGMPSSHSSTVCALATAAIINYGLGSFEFAIATTLALIVMYDARGVRRETGIQAEILNEMMQLFQDMGSDMPPREKLKEFVGHTPFQVIMGAFLGIGIAYLYCIVISPLI